jgi:hypothetical protein
MKWNNNECKLTAERRSNISGADERTLRCVPPSGCCFVAPLRGGGEMQSAGAASEQSVRANRFVYRPTRPRDDNVPIVESPTLVKASSGY